jgi:hypothetical protein
MTRFPMGPLSRLKVNTIMSLLTKSTASFDSKFFLAFWSSKLVSLCRTEYCLKSSIKQYVVVRINSGSII